MTRLRLTGRAGGKRMRQSQYGRPYFVSGLRENDTAMALPRIRLSRPGDDPESQEFRLQRFIMRYPTVLPIGDIEQALVPIVPVCMELPTRSDLGLITCSSRRTATSFWSNASSGTITSPGGR